jgi:hypothetical protein
MFELPNGVVIHNATPHPITFQHPHDADATIIVPPHGIINASVIECVVTVNRGVTYVGIDFKKTEDGIAMLQSIPDGVVVVGSIIAAQAYGGEVVAMTPAPGFERVPPAEKRMNPDKFTTF